MQNKRMKQEFVLLAVPAELMLQVDIFAGDAIAISAEDGRLILENYDEIICSGDCDTCPVGDEDCDGDCESCPCYESCEESEVD